MICCQATARGKNNLTALGCPLPHSSGPTVMARVDGGTDELAHRSSETRTAVEEDEVACGPHHRGVWGEGDWV